MMPLNIMRALRLVATRSIEAAMVKFECMEATYMSLEVALEGEKWLQYGCS